MTLTVKWLNQDQCKRLSCLPRFKPIAIGDQTWKSATYKPIVEMTFREWQRLLPPTPHSAEIIKLSVPISATSIPTKIFS
jgi:hypothetical protein